MGRRCNGAQARRRPRPRPRNPLPGPAPECPGTPAEAPTRQAVASRRHCGAASVEVSGSMHLAVKLPHNDLRAMLFT